MNPRFPLYIVSKGRADTRLTSKALERMNVPYYIVVEPQEVDTYSAVIDPAKVLALDMTYKDNYDTFDELGNTKGKGPGGARNFAWEHSMKNGYEWHWVMDDNIRRFQRLNNNLKVTVEDGSFFYAMEEFVLRYRNIGMAGPNYCMFVPRKSVVPPFVMNTRIYSCNLIRNDTPYRWRGRYNEDTDISLRMLKDGWCTVQFNAFLQEKMNTQALKGGNTDEFYAKEGTMAKSKMQVAMHPDVSRLMWRFGRWHHYVDYKPFKSLKLIKKPDTVIAEGIDEMGMKIVLKGDVKSPDVLAAINRHA
jgi:hypothetical protein